MDVADAVVIGAGSNGLVAANLLADAGWDVCVLEEQDEPGGATRSAELVEPGFVHDVFSSFYPFVVASPVLGGFGLEDFGLCWRRHPLALAHPHSDGSCAVLSEDLDETAASLEAFGAGDGQAWRRLHRLWGDIEPGFLEAFNAPFPPVRGTARIAAAVPPGDLVRLARLFTLPVRRFAAEHFRGAGAGRLLAGIVLHADLSPEAIGSGAFGWILASLGQRYGWPVVEGGSSGLTRALVARLEARGGRVRCGTRVERVVVRRGRAVGVRTAGGEEVPARRAVLADVDATTLYERLLGRDRLPQRVLEDLGRFARDHATIKVDWTLDRPVPWAHPDARRAGAVHVTRGLDGLTQGAADMAMGLLPRHPFLVLGQYAAADPTRQPAGKETVWSYTHVPLAPRGDAAGELSGAWADGELQRFVERMQGEVEQYAPGFGASVRRRHVLAPHQLEERDASLVGGALNGGTAELFQLTVFRPIPAQRGRPETFVRGLYLASSSAHPAGGVHGAPGAIAARAVLGRRTRRRRTAAALGGAAASAIVARNLAGTRQTFTRR